MLVTDEPKSVLVVLPTWVGDYVMATPILRSIRRRFSGAEITWLIEPNLRDMVTGCPWPDRCLEWPDKRRRTPLHHEYRAVVETLRKLDLDLSVLLPNSFRAAMIAYLARARQRIGYNRDGRGLLLTDRVPVKNLRKAWKAQGASTAGWRPTEAALRVPAELPVKPGKYIPMRLVDYYDDMAIAIGCDRPGDQFELHTTPAWNDSVEKCLRSLGIPSGAPLVVLSPGARYGAAKCWMPERFAAVSDRLIKSRGTEVVITCGPGEEPIARKIGEHMSGRGHVLDDPRLSLGELKSLINRCDLLICNDAGPRHFAKAFGKPVVTIFGPTHTEWTATSYAMERIASVPIECGPCQQRTCPLEHLNCMTGVSVDKVYDLATELLEDSVDDRVD
jgi:heptosyltransferase-2